MHCGYFDTTLSCCLTPTVLLSEICAQSDPPLAHFKFALKVTHPLADFKFDFKISAYNVSTVRDSEKKFNYDE